MTLKEAKDHIRDFLAQAAEHGNEEKAFVEGAQQYRRMLALGCDPVTYFRAVFELAIENDPENEVHIRQSELSKWIQ